MCDFGVDLTGFHIDIGSPLNIALSYPVYILLQKKSAREWSKWPSCHTL